MTTLNFTDVLLQREQCTAAERKEIQDRYPKDAFIKELCMFHSSNRTPITKYPSINGKEIDLLTFYTSVISKGGWQKVSDDDAWADVALELSLPHSCLNMELVLRQIYTRYLAKYEKVNNFVIDDPEDYINDEYLPQAKQVSLPAPLVPMTYNSYQHSLPDATRDRLGLCSNAGLSSIHDKLVLSLLSGFDNEIDVVFNVCTLLSHEASPRHQRLWFGEQSQLLELLFAHVGICNDEHFFFTLYESCWKNNSPKNFQGFWFSVVTNKEMLDICYSLKHLHSDDNGYHSFYKSEYARVLQLLTLIRNVSFDAFNREILADHFHCFIFLLLCTYSTKAELREMALDTLSNIVSYMKVENVLTCNRSPWLLKAVFDCIMSSDRSLKLKGMDVLSKMCENTMCSEVLLEYLSDEIYEELISLLSVHDLMVLVNSLETLYQLTLHSELSCSKLVHHKSCFSTLVSLTSFDVQLLGLDALTSVKVVEQPKPAAFPSLSSSKSRSSSSLTESENVAIQWLLQSFEPAPNHVCAASDLYNSYVSLCSKHPCKSLVPAPHFIKCIRMAFPSSSTKNVAMSNDSAKMLVTGLKKKMVKSKQFSTNVSVDPMRPHTPNSPGLVRSPYHQSIVPSQPTPGKQYPIKPQPSYPSQPQSPICTSSVATSSTCTSPTSPQSSSSTSNKIIVRLILPRSDSAFKSPVSDSITPTSSQEGTQTFLLTTKDNKIVATPLNSSLQLNDTTTLKIQQSDSQSSDQSFSLKLPVTSSQNVTSGNEDNLLLKLSQQARPNNISSDHSYNSKPKLNIEKNENVSSFSVEEEQPPEEKQPFHKQCNGFLNHEDSQSTNDQSEEVNGVDSDYYCSDDDNVITNDAMDNESGKSTTPEPVMDINSINSVVTQAQLQINQTLANAHIVENSKSPPLDNQNDDVKKTVKRKLPIIIKSPKKSKPYYNGITLPLNNKKLSESKLGSMLAQTAKRGVAEQLHINQLSNVTKTATETKIDEKEILKVQNPNFLTEEKQEVSVSEPNGFVDSEETPIISSEPPVRSEDYYYCGWKDCHYSVENWQSVYDHCCRRHCNADVYDGYCKWINCDSMSRKRFSLFTHIQEKHCSKSALEETRSRLLGASELNIQPSTPRSHPNPESLYAMHTLYHAVRRSGFTNPSKDTSLTAFEKEGPVSKAVRLSAALILRNLSRHSGEARKIIRTYEKQLSMLAYCSTEASLTISDCLKNLCSS